MDPNRLRDGEDSNERALLESLRADAPSDDVRAGIWQGIAAQAAVASVASTASAAQVTTTGKVASVLLPKALAAKVAVVVAVGAVGAGVALVQPREAPARVTPAVVAPKVVKAPVVEGLPRFAPPPLETCSDAVTPGCAVDPVEPPAPVVKAKRVKRAGVVTPVVAPMVAPVIAPVPLDALRAESKLLAQARARLRANDLAGAEQALNEVRDAFPHGSLGQEREVMQIELLSAVGDREGADHRARRFLRKHPDSPHARSVQRFLIAP